MSKFGIYDSTGYFHSRILDCARDCEQIETKDITKLWGELLKEFYPVAYGLSNLEAGDSTIDDPILGSIQAMPRIYKVLGKIEEYIEPYRLVAEKAVRLEVEKRAKESANTNI